MPVYLAGAGPGDPELLTLKAYRVIREADTLLHDSLVDERILALAKPDAMLIDVGKRCGGRATAQAAINELLCNYGRRRGQITVRLKGGDPMIFGRADEEIAALEAENIGYEIIPGITAACAAAAALKIALTKRGTARSLHFLTGHGADGALPAHDWVSIARTGGTLAVYMGAATLFGAAAHLIEAGMNPAMPAIAIENASLPNERIIRAGIANLPRAVRLADTSGPVLVLIGVALAPAREVSASFCEQKEAKKLCPRGRWPGQSP